MRKWVVLGVILLVIAGSAYFLLRPRDTVEYHKKMFLTAYREEGWTERLWNRVRGGSQGERRLKKHEEALIRLGYLERKQFVVTNIPGGEPMEVIGRTASSNIGGIFLLKKTADPKSKVVIVTAPREDMPKWEKLIGELQAGNGN